MTENHGVPGSNPGPATSSSKPRRGPFAFLLRLALFVLLFVGVGEVWFRTVMPSCDTPEYYQDAEWSIQRYDPALSPEGEFSFGRLTRGRVPWRVNNDGWISAIDYVGRADRDRPMVALLGDSQIEGFYTPMDQHIDPYLAAALSPQTEVYAFAGSGWQLEQFVATSRYIKEAYAPDLLVVFLGVNDVTFSLTGGGQSWGSFWRISASGDEFVEVAPAAMDATRRSLSRMAKLSTVLNYLRFNAKVDLPGAGGGVPVGVGDGGSAAAEAGAGYPSDSWEALVPAAEFMLDRLRAENPGVPIVIAVDGDRYLAPGELAAVPLYPDALAVQAACRGVSDCHFVDLRETFSSDWATNHQEFEAVDGYHWNAYANKLVAQTLATYIAQNDLLGGAQAADPSSR